MTISTRQVTLRARPHRGLLPLGDGRRHRRMVIREPIGRIEGIVDLRLGVGFRAAGYLFQDEIVRLLRARRDGIGPAQIVSSNSWERGQADESSGRDQTV